MGVRDMFSNFLVRQVEKSKLYQSTVGNKIRMSSYYNANDDILQSSDVYELMQDISNQVALATPVVIGPNGEEIENHKLLTILKRPNAYLTGYEFAKLETNELLINGEYFPFTMDDELHLVNNVGIEIDENLNPRFKSGGTEIPSDSIRHIKNIGLNTTKGVGILTLAKNTLDGVMSAEKVLTDKYVKGGLLAFLLKLDANINPTNAAQSKLVKSILDQLESIDDARSVKMIPLGRGYEIEGLKSPVDDAAILNYLGVYKKELGKYLGINVDTYQALMKVDLEKAMMYLHNKAVRPILKNKSEHYSALFFMPDSGYRIEWKINILDFVPYSTKTNIAYNMVRTMITSPDDSREMLGFKRLNTEESSKLYVSKDLIDSKELSGATDDSLKGGDKSVESETDKDV
ncbi:Phage portal protein [Brachybacterium faecium]|nr:Phage portal protein [Brachybacterium faecium]